MLVDDSIVDKELEKELEKDHCEGRWYGKQNYAENDFYEGGWDKEGKYDGFGTLSLPDGYGYKGTWRHGRYHGKKCSLKELKPDGEITLYNGPFRHGVFGVGYGELIRTIKKRKYKLIYKGDFDENGKFTNKGDFREIENGDVVHYKGSFRQDVYCGKGTLKLPDGTVYIGMFKDGLFMGHGELRTLTFRYCGQFFQSSKHTSNGRKAEMTWLPASKDPRKRYVGEWRNGLIHGRGKCIYTNGKIYDGDWKYNKWEGEGTLLNKLRELLFVGSFRNNLYHGMGKHYRQDGSGSVEYEGLFSFGKRHGKGKIWRKDGTIKYEGTFTDNELTGTGIFYFKSGALYVGDVKKSIPHGFGEMTDIFKGKWKGWFKDGRRYRAWVPPPPPTSGVTKKMSPTKPGISLRGEAQVQKSGQNQQHVSGVGFESPERVGTAASAAFLPPVTIRSRIGERPTSSMKWFRNR